MKLSVNSPKTYFSVIPYVYQSKAITLNQTVVARSC